jgi:hypothetical protein
LDPRFVGAPRQAALHGDRLMMSTFAIDFPLTGDINAQTRTPVAEHADESDIDRRSQAFSSFGYRPGYSVGRRTAIATLSTVEGMEGLRSDVSPSRSG